MINRLIRKAKRFLHLKRYSYGYVFKRDGSKMRARLDKSKSNIEFILWQAGQQGHKTNYWHRFGDGWITLFRSDKGNNNGQQ